MPKYINKNGNIIEATEKAFNIVYKGQGYILEEQYLNGLEKSKKKSVSKMKKEEE